MTQHYVADDAYGVTQAAIDTDDLTITLGSGQGATFASETPFIITIANASDSADIYEFIEIESISSDVLTVSATGRGYAGTVALSWAAGSFVTQHIISDHLDEIHDRIDLITSSTTLTELTVVGDAEIGGQLISSRIAGDVTLTDTDGYLLGAAIADSSVPASALDETDDYTLNSLTLDGGGLTVNSVSIVNAAGEIQADAIPDGSISLDKLDSSGGTSDPIVVCDELRVADNTLYVNSGGVYMRDTNNLLAWGSTEPKYYMRHAGGTETSETTSAAGTVAYVGASFYGSSGSIESGEIEIEMDSWDGAYPVSKVHLLARGGSANPDGSERVLTASNPSGFPRVGIGTESPTCTLDVDGDADISGDLALGGDTTVAESGSIIFNSTDGSTYPKIVAKYGATETDIFYYDSVTAQWKVSAGMAIPANSITPTQLATSVAGDGISGGGGTALSVDADAIAGTGLSGSGYTLSVSMDDAVHGTRGGGTTHATATGVASGFMSSADKTKLDGVATLANNYVHPTTAGNKHVPTGGSTYQALLYGGSSGTATWGGITPNYITSSGVPSGYVMKANGSGGVLWDDIGSIAVGEDSIGPTEIDDTTTDRFHMHKLTVDDSTGLYATNPVFWDGWMTTTTDAHSGAGDFARGNIQTNSSDSHGSILGLQTGTGTVISPARTGANQWLGRVGCYGHTGSDWSGGVYFGGIATAAWTTTSTPCRLELYTTASGSTTPTRRMLIDPSGNVGIGLSADTAAAKLHVNGETRTSTLGVGTSVSSGYTFEVDGDALLGNVDMVGTITATGSSFPVVDVTRTTIATTGTYLAMAAGLQCTTGDPTSGFGPGYIFRVSNDAGFSNNIGAIYGIAEAYQSTSVNSGTGGLAFAVFDDSVYPTYALSLKASGRAGVMQESPAARLHVTNADTSAIPCLELDQDDSGEPFIEFDATSGSSTTTSVTTKTTTATIRGHVKVSINRTDYWMPYYSLS